MAQATYDKYIADGTKLIEQHPDLKGGGVDFETAATDQIATILHAVFDGGFDPVDYADGPEALLDAALRCYIGDQEEKEDDDIVTLAVAYLTDGRSPATRDLLALEGLRLSGWLEDEEKLAVVLEIVAPYENVRPDEPFQQ